ncbi:hypothetical protein [Nocardia terpenica]|uniref:Holin n=1 Tax=Nocardia terpenica TaxID=455432 RepID=A0A6G9YZ78_9NOCA|nr:hypothetical protein [Nocardia terpenica]QIS18524.1 hypothetical protein F6W96_09720 [Nocardia terpenica]
MSHPSPAPLSTQSAHPWRATARTVLAAVTGLLAMLPLIVDASGIPESTPGLAGALAIAAGITRVLALPAVNAWLQTYLPWLAAEPA